MSRTYLRHRALSRALELEVLPPLEVAGAGDEPRRDDVYPRVEIAHVGIVEAPGALDPVLGVGQLLLERDVRLAGLELRVALRNREELTQPAGERALVASDGAR